ncbi:hypothetical protein [Streptomyces clavifer]|uniref:hypothetical protein n=1 Tax=Streptomyces clavifer TaxID=68188 RepID=UPI0030902615|nr:hypothetical protein OG388_28605 [Streptomyces clavifer]
MGTGSGALDRDEPAEGAFGLGQGEPSGEDLLPRRRRRTASAGGMPARSSRSLHGVPVRYVNAIASITRR